MTRRPRGAAGAVALVAVLVAALLSGCAAGLAATTDQSYDPTNGAELTIGDIHVANLLVVAGVDGGELTAGIVNTGSTGDALTGVTVETAPPLTLPAPIDLPPGSNVTIGPPGSTRLFVHELGAQPGQLVRVTLTFGDAGMAQTDVLVTSLENVAGGG